MEHVAFQNQILSQINFIDLHKALVRFEKNSMKQRKIEVYTLGSNRLESPRDANAFFLLDKLLNDFRIPSEILDIAKNHTLLGKHISKTTWKYFYNYEFNGRLEIDFQIEKNIFDFGIRPLFNIYAQNCIIDILQAPLNMLLGLIENFSETYKQHQALGASAYYQHNHHSELFIYIDGVVADFYGILNPLESGVQVTKSNIYQDYRVTGIVSEIPFDKNFIKVSKEIAKLQADSTKY